MLDELIVFVIDVVKRLFRKPNGFDIFRFLKAKFLTSLIQCMAVNSLCKWS